MSFPPFKQEADAFPTWIGLGRRDGARIIGCARNNITHCFASSEIPDQAWLAWV